MQQLNILIAGCGDIGSALGLSLLKQGHNVMGLRRNINQLPQGIQGIQADLGKKIPKQVSSLLPEIDILVYCAAAPARTEESYQSTYIEGVNHLLDALTKQPSYSFFTSSSAVYQQHEGEWIDEDSATEPSSFNGKIMLTAEQNFRSRLSNSSIIRFSGIYGPGRNYLLNQVKQGVIAPEQPILYSNRIHKDDCVGVLQHLISRVISGEPVHPLYLASDSSPSPLAEVTGWLAEQLNIEAPEQSLNRATTSKRCLNKRLLESGYQFIHPDFRSGYHLLLNDQ